MSQTTSFFVLSFFDHPLHRFSFADLKNLRHRVDMTTTPNCPVIKFPKVSSWRFFHFSIFLLPPAGSREEHQRSKLLRGDTECNLRRKSKLVSMSKNTQIQNTKYKYTSVGDGTDDDETGSWCRKCWSCSSIQLLGWCFDFVIGVEDKTYTSYYITV